MNDLNHFEKLIEDNTRPLVILSYIQAYEQNGYVDGKHILRGNYFDLYEHNTILAN